jgi:hypothetical protein
VSTVGFELEPVRKSIREQELAGWQLGTVLNRKEGAQRAAPNHWLDRL